MMALGMARALSANRGSSRLPASKSTLRIAIFGRAVMAISSGCRLMRGAYRADGAYGQITTVLPKQGLVVAIQCPESGDFDNIVRPALHEHLLLPLTA